MHHVACLVHLQRNIVVKYKSKGLAKLVGQAACAYRVGGLKIAYNEIRSTNKEGGAFLQKIGQ